MAKYKVSFIKDRKGQTSFERSFSLESLDLLLILCHDFRVVQTRRKSGKIVFIIENDGMTLFAAAQNLPFWVMKRFAPESQWQKIYVKKKAA